MNIYFTWLLAINQQNLFTICSLTANSMRSSNLSAESNHKRLSFPHSSEYLSNHTKQQFQLIIMKKSSLANLGSTDRDYDLERLKLKSSPTAQSMCPAVQSRHKDNVMMFSCDHYPFLNEQHPHIELLKTVVNLPMTTDRLQKIIRLSHPNIIGVRRIMRGNPKQAYPGYKPQTYYSFYYEMVHYDLKTLVQNPSDNPVLLNSILTVDLQFILKSVVAYLQEVGIHYKPNLQNIGVSTNGNIKIYIPPSIVFQSKYDKSIPTAIENIGQWWKQLQIMFHKKYYTQHQYFADSLQQPPKLSYNEELNLDSPLRKSRNYQHKNIQKLNHIYPPQIKPPINIQIKQLAKVGSIQVQKIRKIDQQVKMIRDRLNRALKKSRREFNATPQQRRETENPKPDNKLITQRHMKDQMQKLAESVQKYLVREPIQQNINCINIYNHNAGSISPGLISNQKEPKRPKREQIKVDSELYRNDEDCSLDTYDIEFELNFDMPNAGGQNRCKNTLFVPVLDRDHSQYSDHGYKKSKEGKAPNLTDTNNSKHINQVCKKNCTQSAGPKQFQNFVINIEKPQIPAKKINIDEDPLQYQSQKEQPICNNQKTNQNNAKINQPRPFKEDFKRMDQQNFKNSMQENSDEKVVESQHKDIKRRHSFFNVARKSQIHHQQAQIQAKVKVALAKTKNAIEMLKKVKNGKGSLMRPSASQDK